jgi:hypothetical protein
MSYVNICSVELFIVTFCSNSHHLSPSPFSFLGTFIIFTFSFLSSDFPTYLKPQRLFSRVLSAWRTSPQPPKLCGGGNYAEDYDDGRIWNTRADTHSLGRFHTVDNPSPPLFVCPYTVPPLGSVPFVSILFSRPCSAGNTVGRCTCNAYCICTELSVSVWSSDLRASFEADVKMTSTETHSTILLFSWQCND